MLYADLLCKLHLGVVELVHVAIDVVEVNILVVIRFEVFNSSKFTLGLRYSCDHQMTQNLIGNPVEANAVIDLIKQKLSAVYQHIVDIA